MQTVILISNLHCSSCVNTIKEALSSLTPPPESIHTSIVSQSVTVDHSPDLTPQSIRESLDNAGFDLVDTPNLGEFQLKQSTNKPDWLSRKKEKHAEICLLCREEVAHELIASGKLREDSESLDEKYEASSSSLPSEYRASFSVGGMTCAACTTTITHLVSELPGVSDIAVNLIGKSASATLTSHELAMQVIEAIEEAGYECELVDMEAVNSTPKGRRPRVSERTISLRVEGMFCHHCPDKLMASLEQFKPHLKVIQPLAENSYQSSNAVLRLSYQPSAPDLTIRTIISALENSKSPPFKVTLERPLSLEDRAKTHHQHEQQQLLHRLAFGVIVAIPTFIIGIVYMSLVPSSNSTRQFFMRPMWAGNSSRVQWALFFLATPVMFYSAGMFHRRSLKEIRALWRRGSNVPIWRRFVRFGSMNLLVSMGVSIAYFASIILLALAASQPADASGMGDSTTYFDSVVFLTMFLLAGRFLEAYSKSRTADAVAALGHLRPSEALLVVRDSANGLDKTLTEQSAVSSLDLEKGDTQSEEQNIKSGSRVEHVDTSLLEIGDIVRVPHGATPPLDGIIETGEESAFDESSLTGESKPVKKRLGDSVFVGTINKGKVVDVQITAIGGTTMLDQIVQIVREGQTKRAPIERVADVITAYFVPVVTFLAIITWVIWLALGLSGALPQDFLDIPIGGWPIWSLEFAIAVFVVACPCGVGLAAPTALLVGSGLAAKYGILVRGGGEAFQEAAQLDLIVFDKTGTLTEGGQPTVTDVEVNEDTVASLTVEQVLGIAAELESSSNHPLATAIKKYCTEHGADTSSQAVAIEELAGRGLRSSFTSPVLSAVIGNEAWMSEHDVYISAKQIELLDKWKGEGKSVVLLALRDDNGDAPNHEFHIGVMFAAADKLRPESLSVVQYLQKQGLSTWMISGDNEKTAKAVAKLVGIPETNVVAGVLPHEKGEKIKWLQMTGMKRKETGWRKHFSWDRKLNERCVVGMVGDGINDAPALTAADVSLAIGSGSDVAISSASFVLVRSDLQSIVTLIDLSRTVFRRVKLNFFWAFIYNMCAVPIAAGVIYPAGHARLNPVWASLAMALSSTTVVLSSLMLRLYREPKGSQK